MDIADNAEHQENLVREQALIQVRLRAEAAQAPSGVTECDDCGHDIPAARLEAYPAAIRCVTCQGLYERTHA